VVGGAGDPAGTAHALRTKTADTATMQRRMGTGLPYVDGVLGKDLGAIAMCHVPNGPSGEGQPD